MTSETGTRAIYRQFGAVEAAVRSPLYAEISHHIATGDSSAMPLLLTLPPDKQQPNLLYAAVQYVTGFLTSVSGFEKALALRQTEIVDVMLRSRTQTNLPARCATLLPVLARLPQPLALLEVGCSAGLNLYPDRYGYEYVSDDGPVRIPGVEGAPVFSCRVDGPRTVPVPSRSVSVVWRAGLDLNPLDVTRADDVRWLEALIWPGEEFRRDQLHRAAVIAAADPPHLVRGDLRTDLAPLLASAPRGATLVVLHTAVLAYVDSASDREAFAATVRSAGATWVANEPPTRIPGLTTPPASVRPGEYLLCENGTPVARTDPHALSLTRL